MSSNSNFGTKIQFHQNLSIAIQTWWPRYTKYYGQRVSIWFVKSSNFFSVEIKTPHDFSITLHYLCLIFFLLQNKAIESRRPAMQWTILNKFIGLFPRECDRRFYFRCNQRDFHLIWRYTGRMQFSRKIFHMLSIFPWNIHRRGNMLHIQSINKRWDFSKRVIDIIYIRVHRHRNNEYFSSGYIEITWPQLSNESRKINVWLWFSVLGIKKSSVFT